jgi:hypothetical protein
MCVGLTLLAFINPPLAVVGYVVIVFAYVLPIPRLLAMVRRSNSRKRKK